MAVNLQAVLVVLVSLVLAAPVVGVAWWVDRRVTHPVRRLAVACAWGGVGAIIAQLARPPEWASPGSLVGPGLEAALGALVVLAAVLTVGELDCPADGLVIGLAVGFGWAVAAAAVGAGPAALGVPAASAAPAGAAMMAAVIERRARRVLWAVAAFAAWLWTAVLVRAAVASVGGPGVQVAVVAGVMLLELAVAITVILTAEGRILSGELAEEVRLGTLPAWVATAIPVFAARVRGRWRSSGDERAVLARQLTRLAVRKWSLRSLGPEERRLPGLEVVRLRQRLRTELEEPAGTGDDDALA